MKAKVVQTLDAVGLGVFVPFVRLTTGEDPAEQARAILAQIGMPVLAFAVFVAGWAALAGSIQTSIGAVPGPAAVVAEAGNLLAAHREERAKAAEFAQKMQILEQKAIAEGREFRSRSYTGPPTYIDQIITSLKTVFAGFLIASAIAVPLGILCGLSDRFYTALNPMIQIFKPVSPLAWLPIVMILVSGLYTSKEPMFEKSFISSAITVALCSLWPTLVNTALGVGSIDKDYLNVAKVLNLGWRDKIFKIIIPASLPYIFTGLRLSLGVGWMVLIAAEMLAQNPGLGKFVWDMFQNGSSQTLAQIMVAVFTIGVIGFLLDRVMLTLQQLVSYGEAR